MGLGSHMHTWGRSLSVLPCLVPNVLESEKPKYEFGIPGCYAGIFGQGKGQGDGTHF